MNAPEWDMDDIVTQYSEAGPEDPMSLHGRIIAIWPRKNGRWWYVIKCRWETDHDCQGHWRGQAPVVVELQ